MEDLLCCYVYIFCIYCALLRRSEVFESSTQELEVKRTTAIFLILFPTIKALWVTMVILLLQEESESTKAPWSRQIKNIFTRDPCPDRCVQEWLDLLVMVISIVQRVNMAIVIGDLVPVFVIRDMRALTALVAPPLILGNHRPVYVTPKSFVPMIVVVLESATIGQESAHVNLIERETIVVKNCVPNIILFVKPAIANNVTFVPTATI